MMGLSELPTERGKKKTNRQLLKEYGVILNRRRKERGITMIELSERTGISRKSLELVEKGLSELSETEKLRIAKFLKRQRII